MKTCHATYLHHINGHLTVKNEGVFAIQAVCIEQALQIINTFS